MPPSPTDQFDLQRFVSAQQDTYATALGELQAGRKRTHWMWFILPQLRGLGSSAMADYYGISGKEEARAYLQHATLGPRLLAVAEAVLAIPGRSAREIFGTPDDLKLHSCATLFAHVSAEDAIFQQILDKYFDCQPDNHTLALLG